MSRGALALENAALRHQLTIYQLRQTRLRLRGQDKIVEEFDAKFGIHNSARTIRRYMVRRTDGPRKTRIWRTFIRNHSREVGACEGGAGWKRAQLPLPSRPLAVPHNEHQGSADPTLYPERIATH